MLIMITNQVNHAAKGNIKLHCSTITGAKP